MIFSDDVFSRAIVAVLALVGFFVARHIYKHKKPESTPLICPANFDCEGVVHSNYSTFLGIHLEVWGMIYYGFVFFGYVFLIFAPEVLPVLLGLILFLSSTGAFLVSLYLIGIQIFVLKKGCLWCFVSALVSISIFILSIFAYDLPKLMEPFLR
jgi:uncharacterized membrane protein